MATTTITTTTTTLLYRTILKEIHQTVPNDQFLKYTTCIGRHFRNHKVSSSTSYQVKNTHASENLALFLKSQTFFLLQQQQQQQRCSDFTSPHHLEKTANMVGLTMPSVYSTEEKEEESKTV
ncbi:hypothetical protein HMI56_007189 [Coelomomyces lativittatus]|nr:hypothetical protein HMI56_007189 [Coelomomyces lativittatus]